jgi:hypothetical protein
MTKGSGKRGIGSTQGIDICGTGAATQTCSAPLKNSIVEASQVWG